MRYVSVGGAAILLCLIYFLLDAQAGTPPTRPVALSRVEADAPQPSNAELDQTVKHALERLPAVEDVAKSLETLPTKRAAEEFTRIEGCTDEPVLDSLLSVPREQNLQCIWNSRDFNPRRVPVPKESREQCYRMLKPYLDAATDCRRVANAAGMQEFRYHVDSRSTGLPFISTERYLSILKEKAPDLWKQATSGGEVAFMPAIAFDFEASLFRFAGDGWFGSRIADMRSARPAYEALAFTGLELARAAIEFGLAFGTLTSDEADRLRAAAIAKFDSMIR